MTINQAIHQANRLQRALTILKEGYNFVNCTEANSPVTLVAVYKPNDAPSAPSYWIRAGFTAPEIQNGCSCPDRAKGNICKHEIAWDVLKAEEAMMEALCKEWEARQLQEA